MPQSTFDTLIRGGIVVNHNGTGVADVAIHGGKISDIGNFSPDTAAEVIDARGLHVLPGVIDSQVHFREPGNEHKEDLATGSLAAVMGGVTAVFEMPNTSPSTTTPEALADKIARAKGRMHCDFAFYAGASKDNAHILAGLEQMEGCAGIKVFMGSSTGNLLVADDATVAEVLAGITRRAAFHSEDEYRLLARQDKRVLGEPSSHPTWRDAEVAINSTERLLKLARAAGKRIHVLHISTGEEIEILRAHKDIASVEVTPQHLTLVAPDAYFELGTKAQMNPPIRDQKHCDMLWWGLVNGIVDVIGSDHAPHTLAEKAQTYPASPSGMPGVQTLVPIMLDHVNAGKLSLERFVDLTSYGPQRIFSIAGKGRMAAGYDADFTIVDMGKTCTITDDWSASRCGWTPYAGKRVQGWPVGTIIRGQKVMWEDELVTAASGRPVRFQESLAEYAT
jgi:dihydroorotase